MSQVTSGIHAIFSIPIIYNIFQKLTGGEHARKKFISEHMSNLPEDRIFKVLDIGCGTAEILEYLPQNIQYVGFDISESYINFAKHKYSANKNVTFFSDMVKESTLNSFDSFDVVIATGLLHHIDDDEVCKLFTLINERLTSNGKLLTLDPCYFDRQRKLSRLIISYDRGKNIRTLDEYNALATHVFSSVKMKVHSDYFYIPYDIVVLHCES